MSTSSLLHSAGRVALIIICLVSVLVLALFVLPIYLDIKALRAPVEEILSDIVEAPVTVGDVEVNLSPWPTLRLRDIQVAGSGREEAPIFSRIAGADIRISLLPLMRKELRVKKLTASDLDFNVQRPKGAQGNWPPWTGGEYEVTELADMDLRRITISLDDHELGQADAFFAELQADVAGDRPLRFAMQGTLEGVPLALDLDGPTLEDLTPRATDFPLAAHLTLADLRLALSGAASREPGGTNLTLETELASSNWDFVKVASNLELPDIGGFDLAARASIHDGAIDLRELRGTVGSTAVDGEFVLDLKPSPKRISGRIDLDTLDLDPWMEWQEAGEDGSATLLPFDLLAELDSNLVISIDALTGLAIEIRDLQANVGLTDGELTLPLDMHLAGIPVSAEIEIRPRGELPEVCATLRTADLDVDRLEDLIDIPENLTGSVEHLSLVAATTGHTTEDLAANLTARIEASGASLSSLDDAGEAILEIDLQLARVEHRTGQPLRISLEGDLLEEDFRMSVETNSFDDLVKTDRWPVSALFEGSGATVDARGVVLIRQEGVDLDIDFSAVGDHLGDLEPWFGLPGGADLAYRLAGHLVTQGSTRSLLLHESALGRSRFQGSLSWDEDREQVPILADLHASGLDLHQLQRLLDPITDLDTEDRIIRFDFPVLPSRPPFTEAHIDLQVDSLYREPVDLTDIEISLDVRQGRLVRSPFSFRYDSVAYTGELELDLQGEVPRFALDLTGSAKSLGAVLDKEDLIRDARISADQIELSIAAEGATVNQIIDSADLSGRLTGVRSQITLPTSAESLSLQLPEVHLTGPRGEPIVLETEGSLNEEPLQARIVIRQLDRKLTGDGTLVPFEMQAAFGSTEIELGGELSLPVTEREFDLGLQVSGESLSDLSPLADLQLPDLGPYRLAGHLVLTPRVFTLESFDLNIGESDLHGSMQYRMLGGRPTIVAEITSERSRSVDYLPPILIGDQDNGEESAPQRPAFDLTSSDLSLASLRDFDASVDLQIAELDTGSGPFENVTMTLELDEGHLFLSMQRPQENDTPAQILAQLKPLDRGTEADLRVSWVRQPYGLLADILNPVNAHGSWSLDLALRSQGDSLAELLQNLSGRIDFTDYPEDFDATILDLWGGSLIPSLMPVFKISEQSRINCTIGRFEVDEGVMRPEILALDATRSRVNMHGHIDLPNRQIRLRLKPRPKQRNLINLATPVRISGSLTDPKVRFTTSGLAKTFFRLSLWAYTVWIDILRQPLPKDGSDICLDPLPRGS